MKLIIQAGQFEFIIH